MNRARGFTLVELMIALLVGAILLTVAVPSFRWVIEHNRLATQANALATALNLARSEAVKRGAPVSVCTSTNGTSCTQTPWAQGWIVFTDSGSDGVVNNSDTVLRVTGAVSGQVTITEANFTNADYVPYLPTGFLSGLGGQFTVCTAASSTVTGTQITVANTGQVISNDYNSCP